MQIILWVKRPPSRYMWGNRRFVILFTYGTDHTLSQVMDDLHYEVRYSPENEYKITKRIH
jgi:hypothetical protein